MPLKQDDIFFRSEGNRWFRRNRAALDFFNPAEDLPMRLMELYGLAPKSVLEIGAANGFRLEALRKRHGSRVVGIETAAAAVRDGRRRFPLVRLLRGRASRLPAKESFDLIIINFVFHWIDRAELMTCAAEVDRVLKEGGHVILGDFLPNGRLRVPYHHLPRAGIFTYKQNYAGVFLATGLYHPVALLTAHHANKRLSAVVAEDDRIGTWLLRKDTREGYRIAGRP